VVSVNVNAYAIIAPNAAWCVCGRVTVRMKKKMTGRREFEMNDYGKVTVPLITR
jgi:hypothetical protein